MPEPDPDIVNIAFQCSQYHDRVRVGYDVLSEGVFQYLPGLRKAAAGMPDKAFRMMSAWDYFKMLVHRNGKLWWTQQWLMGYIAFCMMLFFEGKHSGCSSKQNLGWRLTLDSRLQQPRSFHGSEIDDG